LLLLRKELKQRTVRRGGSNMPLTRAEQKLRYIRQTIRGIGTQASVINSVDMLCDLVEELYKDARILMPKLQQEVSTPVETSTLPETKVPIPENKGSVEGSAADETTKKTKPVEDTQMSTDEKPNVDVDSSVESAAEAIKKEKEKKKKMLENIFSDNKTGRYSGPIDS